MKGVIFTELLELVEDQFGYEVVDKMISEAALENGGAFTSIGTYDHGDLLKMVVSLSNQLGVEVPVLVKTFGKHLFKTFSKKHASKIAGMNSAFELIEKVESFIHVEVRKIYPDAQLPTFEYEYLDEDTLIVKYRSERPFADVCEGLMEQCIEHFGEEISISRTDIEPAGTATDFMLKKAPQMAGV